MSYLFSLILVVHILVAIGIIGLVLLQHGKGADMGAAFGGGSSGSLFGATGSANFLSRTTAALAVVFFITSLSLAYISANKPKSVGGVMQDTVQSAPVSTEQGGSSKLGGSVVNDAPAGDSKSKEIPK